MNLCTTCGEDFGSVSAFDAHRIGKYPQKGPAEYVGDRDEWTPGKGRRCLDVDELREAGFVKNSRGAWSTSPYLTTPGVPAQQSPQDATERAA